MDFSPEAEEKAQKAYKPFFADQEQLDTFLQLPLNKQQREEVLQALLKHREEEKRKEQERREVEDMKETV